MQNLYNFTVPVFINTLGGLKNVLTKAETHAKEVGMSEATLINDRLAPDMFPLKRQVQIACDQAKGAASRLTDKENPKMEDTEETFAELHARIDKTLAYLKEFSEQDFVGAEDRHITLPYFPDKYLTGADYVMYQSLPNFFFHVTTAYDIARKNGAPLSKADFVNGLPLRAL